MCGMASPDLDEIGLSERLIQDKNLGLLQHDFNHFLKEPVEMCFFCLFGVWMRFLRVTDVRCGFPECG